MPVGAVLAQHVQLNAFPKGAVLTQLCSL